MPANLEPITSSYSRLNKDITDTNEKTAKYGTLEGIMTSYERISEDLKEKNAPKA